MKGEIPMEPELGQRLPGLSAPAAELRQYARNKMRRFPAVWLGSIVYFAVSAGIAILQNTVSGQSAFLTAFIERFPPDRIAAGLPENAPEIIDALARTYIVPSGTLLALALSVVLGVVTTGFTWYLLRAARGETPRAMSIFAPFARAGSAAALYIIKTLLVSAGFLLLIAPGVFLVCRWSMAERIMYDHPEYGVFRCLRESAKVTRGRRARYFTLVLSFIGWALGSLAVSVFL
ncbi:MAG: DUF975 family protein, partial [Oscillospiraceae bacterium]|nr:DUF975 family protein [Oscillospiraceae bacterium]